jgi:hypothetical protein
MAEALLGALGKGLFEAFSAGSFPMQNTEAQPGRTYRHTAH